MTGDRKSAVSGSFSYPLPTPLYQGAREALSPPPGAKAPRTALSVRYAVVVPSLNAAKPPVALSISYGALAAPEPSAAPKPAPQPAPPVIAEPAEPAAPQIPLSAVASESPDAAAVASGAVASGAAASAAVASAAVAESAASAPKRRETVVDPSLEPAIAVLELQDISKSYGDKRANDGISLTLRAGQKLALLGENGAGKSTLVKIAYGMLQPDGGKVLLDGVWTRIGSPAEARRRGIGMVFQHFSTFDALSVAENLAVALPGRSISALKRDLREIGKSYGLELDPGRRVGSLSAGEKQRLEIVRCLLQDPRVLILDEPTSVLTPQESEALFATLDRLAGEGVAILYISHRLEDVRRLCDSAVVLRDGRVVGSCDPRETSAAALGEMMIGTATLRPKRGAAYVGAARLEVKELSLPARDGGVALRGITFAARKGEILGIAGVAGEGQPELFAALSGETPSRDHEAVRFDGKPVGRYGPLRRRKLGAAFAPEERLGHAAIPEMRLSENLRLTLPRATVATSKALRERFSVVANGRDPYAGALSGGNLQKFVVGREISRDPGILIVEQPSWGVDVGSAAAIHQALLELRERKAAIVIISQDLDEIFALCDRVAVLHRGTLSEPRVVSQVTAEELGLLMGGAELQADAPEAAHA